MSERVIIPDTPAEVPAATTDALERTLVSPRLAAIIDAAKKYFGNPRNPEEAGTIVQRNGFVAGR